MFLVACTWQGIDAEDVMIYFLGDVAKVKQLVLQYKLSLLDLVAMGLR